LESCFPTKVLSNVDFPAFGFPRIAIGIHLSTMLSGFAGWSSRGASDNFSSRKYFFLMSRSCNSGRFLLVFALIPTISSNHKE